MKAKPSMAKSTSVGAVASNEPPLVARAPAKLTSNWLSTVFVTWINPLLKLGSRRPLDVLDLCPVPDCFVADPLAAKISKAYEKQTAKASEADVKSGKPPKFLFNALISVFGLTFIFGGLFLLSELVYLMPPMILTAFVDYMQDPARQVPSVFAWLVSSRNFIWFAPLFMFFLQITSTIYLNTYFMAIRYLGIRVRTAVSGLIYRKSLRLSCSARQVFFYF